MNENIAQELINNANFIYNIKGYHCLSSGYGCIPIRAHAVVTTAYALQAMKYEL